MLGLVVILGFFLIFFISPTCVPEVNKYIYTYIDRYIPYIFSLLEEGLMHAHHSCASLYAGCDGIPNSGLVNDACGVCAGDGSTCAGESNIVLLYTVFTRVPEVNTYIYIHTYQQIYSIHIFLT
jgi:hypothetical protein